MISKVEIIEIVKKVIKWDNKLQIYTNGKDNAYPEKTDRLINNSVTAKMASNLMVQYLIGKGFGEQTDDTIINAEEGTTLLDFAKQIAQDIVDHRGFYVHVNYEIQSDGSILETDPKLIPFGWCRIGKKDDKKYNGKILVKSDWLDTKEEAAIYDVYNPKQNVVKSQINHAGGIKKYKGQIYFYNLDNKYYYPLSRIDCVESDCDSEAQAGNYKNTLLRDGFYGKTVVVVRPLMDDTIEEMIHDEDSGERIRNKEYDEAVTETEETIASIKKFIGSGNAGGILLLQMDNAGDKLEDTIKFIKVESDIEPDLFINLEKTIRENILIAFNNMPIGLVRATEGLFSQSGEAIKSMKQFYWENTNKERDLLEYAVNKFVKFKDGKKLKVINLIEEPAQEPKTE